MIKLHLLALLAIVTTGLSGCSGEPTATPVNQGSPPVDSTQVAASETPPATNDTNIYGNFDNTNTIRDIMSSLVDPNAKQMWDSVKYVVGLGGVEEETFPHTDEDWRNLKANAIALIEAANALMIPGRKVSRDPLPDNYPDFQFPPEQIEKMINDDPDTWIAIVQDFQATVFDTLATINQKNLLTFSSTSSDIDNTCNRCHARFWYRPQ